MKERDLFLMSDAALRDVIDMLDRDQLSLPVPVEWSRKPSPTLRDVVAAHAYDEAWVPDVLAGRTVDEVGDRWKKILGSDDVLATYDEVNDAATEAVMGDHDLATTVHFTYGDFSLAEGFVHLSTYRAFQAWAIAHVAGLDFSLPDSVVDGLTEHVLPQADFWRSVGVFGPEVKVPADADAQTVLLGKTGYWRP
ncbi:MAG: hypothetical protein JWO10_9 [Microbacteriaceae bacterium]|nr:hypothetical protein [Microbacteriaceae bacterium]